MSNEREASADHGERGDVCHRDDGARVADVKAFEVTVMASVDECFAVTMEEGGTVRALKVAIAERTGMRRWQPALFLLRDIIAYDNSDTMVALADDAVIERACTIAVQWKYCEEMPVVDLNFEDKRQRKSGTS